MAIENKNKTLKEYKNYKFRIPLITNIITAFITLLQDVKWSSGNNIRSYSQCEEKLDLRPPLNMMLINIWHKIWATV